ncbi:MAG: iron-sulfur cluster insertion protein ErpA [Rhodospirillaceae bacterium]|nr:iron-sulfur cluster insertion protein ErpA [Rhodospirillaceae bacterium]|tara:strand:- start:9878 stop:10231 length:354 start_codon:yes stop_codon:yes gene_type:complete
MSEAAVQTGINVTPDAAKRIGEIMAAEHGSPETGRLRIVVTGGGCSGFQYHFKIDEGAEDGDIEYVTDGAKVVVDDVSLQFLAGSTLEFIQNLEGSYFTLENPNATSSCGCGTSFAI